MYILTDHNNTILQFGSGLVGTAVLNQLLYQYSLTRSFQIEWNAIEKQKVQIQEFILGNLNSDKNIWIIWTAGKAGFSASTTDIENEWEIFVYLNEVIKSVIDSNKQVNYVLISSAGGLFEGKTSVTNQTPINIKRPYSQLKHNQEQYIINEHWINAKFLVRLSSVYTTENLSGRMGLIPVLMYNGINNIVSKIYGSNTTLRDYILDIDIGRFIKKLTINSESENVVKFFHLVEGRPRSIQEIVSLIERIIGKKMYLQFSNDLKNSDHITFAPSMKAKGFETSELDTNLRKLYNSLLV